MLTFCGRAFQPSYYRKVLQLGKLARFVNPTYVLEFRAKLCSNYSLKKKESLDTFLIRKKIVFKYTYVTLSCPMQSSFDQYWFLSTLRTLASASPLKQMMVILKYSCIYKNNAKVRNCPVVTHNWIATFSLKHHTDQ